MGWNSNAHGHLMDQFISPLTNKMDAPYGGSLTTGRGCDGRLAACRKRVGDKFILGVRYGGEEAEKGGITIEEGIAMGAMLRDSGMVDFVNINRGRIHTDPAMTDMIPIQGMKSAPHLDLAGRIKAEVGLPTFHAARIPDVATARYAVASGQLDMVGMTRAHMADPHIVRKIVEGREDDIRPCVGATYCLDRIYQGGMALCIHNPATGREETMPHDHAEGRGEEGGRDRCRSRRAGSRPRRRRARPSGCGLRGRRQPGGQVRLTAQTKRRSEMIGIIDWRMAQCAARDVEFRFNTWAEAADVLAEKPDVVIVATGGLPQKDILAFGNDLTVRPGTSCRAM
jgi:hypothetical protein